jgi:hypothetical protein
MFWLLACFIACFIGVLTVVSVREIKRTIKHMEVKIMSELANVLTGISAQLTKAKDEIVKKIADLETALATAGGIPEDAQVALDALKAQAQVLDDIVPDVASETPTTPPV